MSHEPASHVAYREESDPMNVTNPEHGAQYIVSPLQYTIVFAILIVTTLLSWGSAYLNLGILNPIIVLTIACLNTVLTVLFFMHVKYSSRLIKMTVGAGFFMLLVLITMTLTDYMSRAWGRW